MLIQNRYPGTPLSIPPRGPLAVLHASPATPFNTPNYPEHPYRCTSGLVTTMVLAEAITGLDTIVENPSGLAG